MRHRAIWLAGVVVLVGAGPANAQTGAGGSTTAIPRTNQTHAPTTGGLNLTAPLTKTGGPAPGVGSNHRAGGSPLITPIPKTGGATTGGSLGGFGAKHTGMGSTGSTAATGGGVMGGRLTGQGVVGTNLLGNGVVGTNLLGQGVTGSSVLGNGSAAAGNQIALLAEARLLVLQLEATGNLSLNRRESMLLTLLVYEALRQQAVQLGAGAGVGTAPTTGTTYP